MAWIWAMPSKSRYRTSHERVEARASHSCGFVLATILAMGCGHSPRAAEPPAHSETQWQVISCTVRLPTCTGETTSEYLVCGEIGGAIDEICRSLFDQERWAACHADKVVRVGQCPTGVDKVKHTVEGGKIVYRRETSDISPQ